MAITLLADIGASDTAVLVNDADFASRKYPFAAQIDAEVVVVRGGGFDSAASDGTYHLIIERAAEGSTAATHAASAELVPMTPSGAVAGGIALAPAYAGSGSFQTVAADVDLDPAAGNVGTNPKFLAAMMGNAIGADMTKAGAYIAGVIAALSVTGTKASEYQVGALLGIVMDGVTDADAAVVAVIDGSDPSAPTRANAAFAARMNNNDAGSGVDYGLDLYDPGNANYTGGPVALPIAKALVRGPSQACYLEGDGAPVDGTTGDNFAGKGSIYVDYTNGEAYINTGTITDSVWKQITHAA